MMKCMVYFSILICLLISGGCSSGSSEAPEAGAVHPANWVLLHGADASADLRGCQGCHGFDFAGSGAAISCYSCHISGPPFSVHIASWTDVVNDHQGFANDISWTSCAVASCHGEDLQGGNGPSCLNAACHFNTGGDPPAPASHQGVDFTDPVNHGAAAGESQYYCLNCHGRPIALVDGGFISNPDIMNNLDFNAIAVTGNCSTCHPAAGAHPTNWQGSVDDTDPTYNSSHRGTNLTTQSLSCRLCHNVSGPGISVVPAAPSCYASNHTNANAVSTNCHPNGPRTAPHATDGSYLAPGAHGKEAKQDLVACQGCHADDPVAGPGDNPRFNSTIGTLVDGCEAAGCHSSYYAHPSDWAGPNTSFHYSAGNLANACSLCHGAALNGAGGISSAGGTPGQSCLDCHAETTAFTLDCDACHGFPPDGVTPEPLVGGVLVDHDNAGNAASVDVSSGSAGASHDTCLTCHGVKATGAAAGDLSPAANYSMFNPTTDTPGDHWDGQINMNGPSGIGSGYDPATYGCDNAACHPNDVNHQLSDSTLSVAFGDYGTGTVPHAVDGSYLAGAAHGPTAKSDLAGCKTCHGEVTNIDPRFNVGINSQGGNGCEGCHNDFTAHPAAGARENIDWYDVTWRHATGSISAATCGMCHPGGAGWVGTTGPACTSCHVSDPANATVGSCTSCHAGRPNGAVQPNREGEHWKDDHRVACTVCHTNAGPGSADHFTRPSPNYSRADLKTGAIGTSLTIDTVTNAPNVTCSGNCHDGHSNESWY